MHAFFSFYGREHVDSIPGWPGIWMAWDIYIYIYMMQPPRSPPSPPNGYGYTGAMFSAPLLWVGGGVSSSSSSSSSRHHITSHHITSHHITSHHITSHSIHTLMHAHNKRYSNAKSGEFWICFWSLSLLQGNICITSQRMLECNYAPDSPRKYLDDALTTLNQYGHAPLLPFLCKTTKT